jgi:FAD/FMN-containing dehydrogenase
MRTQHQARYRRAHCGSAGGFVRAAAHWVASHAPDGLLICYGHVGSPHFNISRIGADARFWRVAVIKRAIHDLVAQYGGSIGAEHGIGRLKVDEWRWRSVRLSVMRAIGSRWLQASRTRQLL